MNISTPHRPKSKRGASIKSLQAGLSTAAIAAACLLSLPSYADAELEALKKEVESIKEKLNAAEAKVNENSKKSSPVSIYGIFDTGVEYVTNVGADKETVTRVPPITATLPSRLGFKLDHEVSPGLHAIGTLEAGFNMDDGNSLQGGRIFGRQLFFGVKTESLGSITLGRQWSMLTGAMARGSDQIGPNVYALGSLDSYLPNSRYDNSIAWKRKFGALSTGVSYSLGRDTSGGAPAHGTCAGEQNAATSTQECRGLSAMARYDSASFGLGLGMDRINGGSGATAYFFNGKAPIGFSDSSDTDTRLSLGGYYKFGGTQIGLGWLGRDVETDAQDVSADIYYMTASHKLSPKVKIDGGIHRVTNDDQDTEATLSVVRAFYNLGKSLSVYGQVGYISNDDGSAYQLSVGPNMAPVAGDSQTGYMVGIRYIYR